MRIKRFILALLVGLVLAVGGALSATVAVGEESTRAGAELADVDWATVTPDELEAMILAGKLNPSKVERAILIDSELQGHIRSPMTWVAIDSDNPDLVDVLVKHGADVNWADEETGLTALHFAVRRGNTGVAKRLLEFGADANKKDNITFAPAVFMSLNLGDSQETIRMIELLLGYGAKLNIADEPKGDALSTNILMASVARIVNSSDYGERRELMEVLRYLVKEKEFDINTVPETQGDQLTAMHIAPLDHVGGGIVYELVRLGGDVNVASSSGLTPLMSAVANVGNLSSVETLIVLGADIDAKDIKEQTAIDYARMRVRGDFDAGYISGRYAEYFSSLDEWRNFGVQAEEILLKHIDEEKAK